MRKRPLVVLNAIFLKINQRNVSLNATNVIEKTQTSDLEHGTELS